MYFMSIADYETNVREASMQQIKEYSEYKRIDVMNNIFLVTIGVLLLSMTCGLPVAITAHFKILPRSCITAGWCMFGLPFACFFLLICSVKHLYPESAQ